MAKTRKPDRPKRLQLSARIDTRAYRTIERIAKRDRTTPAAVARVALEDWASDNTGKEARTA